MLAKAKSRFEPGSSVGDLAWVLLFEGSTACFTASETSGDWRMLSALALSLTLRQ